MKLRTIEISGFKSFADHTKIDFKDGITGIVGPNGSGKSNIIEAIRWVMGETSAKSLRGGKMPDVIFSGTQKRKPLSRAAVSIVFDNSDHFLDSKFDEVMISRRLFRNGESQYELNHQECRLKDILNLFIDTGLGRESLSVISQGKIEEIFNSKPEDRRTIIEEAAGVLEYKQDKRRAESELEKTSGYLERVNDLIVELQKQVEPLEEQAAVAKDYLQQKKRFDRLEQTRLVRTITHNSDLQKRWAKEAEVKQTEAHQLENKLNELVKQRDRLKEQVNQQSKQKDDLQAELVRLNRLEQQLAGEHDLQIERRKYFEQEQTRLTEQIEQVQGQIDAGQQDLKDLEQLTTDLNQQIKKTKQALQLLTDDHQEQKKADLQAQIEDLRAQYVDHLQKLTSLKNQYSFSQQDQKRDEQQRLKVELNLARFNKELQELQTKLAELNQAVANTTEIFQKQTGKLQELTQRRNRLSQEYEEARQQWLDGSDIVHRATSKLEALTSLKNEHTGFYQGVRAVLQQRERFPGLVGPVADVIEVPEQYTVAIETALGSQIQNVVVDTDQTAKSIIEFLKKQRQGRVTFLPRNTLQARTIRSEMLTQVHSLTGFCGVASDLIKVANVDRVVSQHLLGTTLIADNLDHALQISQRIQRRYRVITLAGDVVGVGGTMTGGTMKHGRQGLLQQDQEIKRLQTQIAEMKQKLAIKERHVQELLAQGKQVQGEIAKLTETQRTSEQSKVKAENQVSLTKERIAELERRIKATNFELTQLSPVDDAIQKLPAQISELEAKIQDLKDQTAEKQKQLALFDNDAEARQEQRAELQIKLAKLNEQYSQKEQQFQTARQTQIDLQDRLEEIRRQLVQLQEEQSSSAKSQIQAVNLVDVQKRLKQREEAMTNLQTEWQKAQVAQDRVIADYELTQKQCSEAQSQVQEAQNTLALVESKIELAADQLNDDYQQTFESAQAVVDQSLDDEQLRRELKLLRRGLDELGTVNLGAIAEYERVSTRYNFLKDQKEDLSSSKQQLEQSIAEIDQEASQRFKQTFDQVAEEFGQVFVKMFGGGHAELELTDPDNLLTTGIEIKAQPPGKKLQRLSLLSGGEKSLTAITLLFAILQVKPVPFCILDEVEAAFDDANVDRFAKYLRTFQDTTQFIVITHRKGTMMEADVLYGVTMQESGVSKMVSVSVDEIERREQVG